MGTLSANAWAAPGKEFSVPGPTCDANTPRRLPLVVRLNPSAMAMPTRSCLQMTGLTPALAQASISGWAG